MDENKTLSTPDTSTETSESTTENTEVESTNSVQADQSVTTENQAGQTEQNTDQSTEGSEETFFDPNQVPDELKPAYKQMQAAFTKKTQEIAQIRKEHETLKQKAEGYSKYDQLIPIVEEMLSSQNNADNKVNPEMVALEKRLKDAGYTDDAIEMIKIGAEFTLNQFNQKEQAKAEQQKAIAERTATEGRINEAENIDPRLKDDNIVYEVDGEKVTFGTIVAEHVLANPNWRKDPVAATKRAIKLVDAMIGKAKTEGKEELSTLAKTKSQKFPNLHPSPQGTTNGGKPRTISEAAEMAEQQLGY